MIKETLFTVKKEVTITLKTGEYTCNVEINEGFKPTVSLDSEHPAITEISKYLYDIAFHDDIEDYECDDISLILKKHIGGDIIIVTANVT
jgi:hypothetical protein